MRIKNLTIINEPAAKKPRITLRNCYDVELQNVTITGLDDQVEAVEKLNSSHVRIGGLTRDKGGKR